MELEELRSSFLLAYAAVPAKMRGEIIALVDDRPYNWDSAYIEIFGRTAVGNEILKHLENIGLLSK